MSIEQHDPHFQGHDGSSLDESNDFCIPVDCCPKRFPSPKLPSPNSCLPQGELEELEAKIALANRLLLDLGLSDRGNGFDENGGFEALNEEARMRAFDGLVGQIVKVEIDCESDEEARTATFAKTVSTSTNRPRRKNRKKRNASLSSKRRIARRRRTKKQSQIQAAKRKVEGRVHLVGRNFVLLKNEKKEYLIPLLNICSISPKNKFAPSADEADLLCIDPCFRRALTFQFGPTVASSPELIQIFYRIPLNIYLLLLEGKKIHVKGSEKQVTGILKKVDKEQIRVGLKKNREKTIALQGICYLVAPNVTGNGAG